MASCYGDVLAVERQELESSKGRVWVKSGAVYFLSSRTDALARNAARAEADRTQSASDAAGMGCVSSEPNAPSERSTAQ